jgi:poly(3-hydroxybutyrate) depolymerase
MKNCTYVLRTVLCLILITAGVKSGFSQLIETGLRSSTGEWLGFLEYKPTNYSKTTTKYPLIIFLHGIGERGNGTTDLKYVARIGLPRMIKQGHNMTFTFNGKTETFLVLMPQCPTSYGMWPNAFVNDLIAYAKKNLRIDEDRIFLTGLSMGGGGSMKYISTAADQPKNLAAVATVCAPCTFQKGKYVADANLPVWAFHALDDPTAPESCTEAAIRKINEANPAVKPLKTIWPTGGHGVWDRMYTDTNYRYNGVTNIYEWFLGQNRTFAVNKLPKANAGKDINITTGTGVATLDGSASTDADGKIVRYVWKKISGPAAGAITHAFGPNSSTTVTGLTVAGTYKYQLSVLDNRATYTSDTITVVVTSGVSVANKAPIARAGVNFDITLPTNTAKLDGSGSEDTDGSISKFAWTQVSGPDATISTPSEAITSIKNMAAGTYVFKLAVTDNKGTIGSDLITVVVNPAPTPKNIAPVAKAGGDVTLTLPENKTVLNGSGSSDQDGSIASYQWSKLSGPSQFIIADESVKSTNLTNLSQGTYKFILTVTDNDGATDDDTVTIKVNAALPVANVAPDAQAGANKIITLPLDHTTLDGSNSTDIDGTIASYKWSYVSGPESYTLSDANAVSTDVNGLAAGNYSFRLEVKDNDGDIDADTVTVQVKEADAPPPPPNKTPIAKAGNDITITLPLNEVTLDGSTSEDEDGKLTNYSWLKIDGPAQYRIVSQSYHITKVENLVEGIYHFRLQVKDREGALGYDTIKVTVLKAPNEIPASRAGNKQEIQLPVDRVELSGKNSFDPDGTVVKYYWEYVTGPSGSHISDVNAEDISVTGLKEGQYKFRLTVTDNEGGKASSVVFITVLPEPSNEIPVSVAGADIEAQLPDPFIKLDGSASYDPDGTIVGYSWVKASGPGGVTITGSTTATPTIVGLSEGTYVFRLTVTDDHGNIASDVMKVTVHPEPQAVNKAPEAYAGSDQTIGMTDIRTSLDGSNSSDDNDIASYQWRQVGGPAPASIASPTTAITDVNGFQSGEYEFELKVTDAQGLVSIDTVRISVINNMRYEEGLTLYPNPARATINVDLTSDTLGPTRVTIYNASGMVVHAHNTNKTQVRLFEMVGISTLQRGMYYLEVIVDGKQRKLSKFVKN